MSLSGSVAGGEAATRLADMAWMTGVWRARNGVDQVENVYLPAKNGEIVGTFTATVDNTVTRYELLSFREENGKIMRREVAFGPALQSAPPVPTLALISTDATHVRYANTEITRTGDDSMTVRVVLNPANAPARTVLMEFRRVLNFSAP